MENPPPPPPEDLSEGIDECRLWIGNISTKMTEFSMLKLLQRFGGLKKFDYLYHRSGPDQGKPRGYCFVTFSNKEEAERASKQLNGVLASDRRLVVKYAHVDQREEVMVRKRPRPEQKVEITKKAPPPLTKESQIRAIEAKLKMMEKSGDDVSSFVPPSPTARTWQPETSSSSRPSTSNLRQRHTKPYERHSNSR